MTLENISIVLCSQRTGKMIRLQDVDRLFYYFTIRIWRMSSFSHAADHNIYDGFQFFIVY